MKYTFKKAMIFGLGCLMGLSEPKEDVIYNFRRADEEGRTNITKRWDGKDMTCLLYTSRCV